MKNDSWKDIIIGILGTQIFLFCLWVGVETKKDYQMHIFNETALAYHYQNYDLQQAILELYKKDIITIEYAAELLHTSVEEVRYVINEFGRI